MEATPSLIFISGGVRSGKSSFAEKLAKQALSENGGQLYYLATGVPFDQEIKQRIDKHQHDRASGNWLTIEQSVNIGQAAKLFTGQDIVLLDCVTTLLNNELFLSCGRWDERFLQKVKESIVTGIQKISERVKTMIVVSNEVLNEPIAETELNFTYSRLLGHIHQQLVKAADQAYLVEAGISIMMKGGGKA